TRSSVATTRCSSSCSAIPPHGPAWGRRTDGRAGTVRAVPAGTAGRQRATAVAVGGVPAGRGARRAAAAPGHDAGSVRGRRRDVRPAGPHGAAGSTVGARTGL